MKKFKMQTLRQLFFTVFFGFFLVMMLIFPSLTSEAALKGLLIWATILLPTLFPFLFFSKLLVTFGDIQTISKPFSPLTKKLWRSPASSAYLFFMSLLSGYPVGAKLLADEVMQGRLTEKEAKQICTFTSTSGPMFLVGSVGTGFLISPKAGYLLFVAHLLGAVLNGILWAHLPLKKRRTFGALNLSQEKKVQQNPILASAESVFVVGGYVCIFSVITAFCTHFGVFNIILSPFSKISGLEGLLAGLLEMTNGTMMIAGSSLTFFSKVLACEAIVTFGGLSVVCQAMTFLKPAGISTKFFILQKITHVIFACVICFALLLVFQF